MAQRESKIYQFHCDIYPRTLWVAVGVPTKVLNEYFMDEVGDLDESTDAEVTVAQRKDPLLGGVLVRFAGKNAMTTDNMAHEAAHAAIQIFDYVGCRISVDNQEPFAYLVGWCAKKFNLVKYNKANED